MKNTILNIYNSIYNFETLAHVCWLHSEYVSAMNFSCVALKLIEDNTMWTGPDHVEGSTGIYQIMGLMHWQLGDYQQAKGYYERALSIRLNMLGPDHVDVAETYHGCLLYTSPSPRDGLLSRMPSSA